MARPSLAARRKAAAEAAERQPPAGLAAASPPPEIHVPDRSPPEPKIEAVASARPEMRPDPRPVQRKESREDQRAADPQAAAAARAAELMGHLGDLDEGTDEFYIDRDIIPPGWDYQWKRRTVMGAEDPAYEVAVRRSGWEAVPASRHPEMMPLNGRHATVERKGMVLMERPKTISDRASQIELQRAKAQVRQKEEQLSAAPPGHFERDSPLLQNRVTHDYAPIDIPE